RFLTRRSIMAVFGVYVLVAGGLVAFGVGMLVLGTSAVRATGGPDGSYLVPPGIHKIKHVIVIMQENRSFDEYFGTYPGADGIAMRQGVPVTCVPDPVGGA